MAIWEMGTHMCKSMFINFLNLNNQKKKKKKKKNLMQRNFYRI